MRASREYVVLIVACISHNVTGLASAQMLRCCIRALRCSTRQLTITPADHSLTPSKTRQVSPIILFRCRCEYEVTWANTTYVPPNCGRFTFGTAGGLFAELRGRFIQVSLLRYFRCCEPVRRLGLWRRPLGTV